MQTTKIQLRLNKRQRSLLRKWCGVYRWTYNQCISALNKGTVRFYGEMHTRRELRALFVNAGADLLRDKPWVTDVPYDVRDGAVIEAVKNLNTELGKWFKNRTHRFTMKFKSVLDTSISIPVLNKHWKNGVWFRALSKTPLRGYEDLPTELVHDAKIVKTRLNEFHLCVSKDRKDIVDTGVHCDSAISLDPGVRTFLTGYDPAGKVLKVANGNSNELFKMCRKVDIIMSRVNRAKNHRQRYHRRRAAARAREKIKNRIRDLHHKAAKHLCENYKHIILPVFATRGMVRRVHRKINSKTARTMLTFSHYSFRQVLIDKAKSYNGVRIYIVNESYTSKTCTRCGHINAKLGGAEVFKCPVCHLVIDRDVNGARNIMIRSTEAIIQKMVEAGVSSVPSGPTPLL